MSNPLYEALLAKAGGKINVVSVAGDGGPPDPAPAPAPPPSPKGKKARAPKKDPPPVETPPQVGISDPQLDRVGRIHPSLVKAFLACVEQMNITGAQVVESTLGFLSEDEITPSGVVYELTLRARKAE